MALTWRRAAPPALATAEGQVRYSLSPGMFQVQPPWRGTLALPIEASVGGPRHGVSFLVRVAALDGVPLARPVLVEARYLQSRSGALAVSPGFPDQEPKTLGTAIGRVLSPTFEIKCLSCHRSPEHSPTASAGVHCEDCHGPGQPHIEAISKGKPGVILNPAKVSPEKVLEVCAQCHAGFSDLVDPPPHDLLISNQVTALRNSECYVQSGGGFSCTNCHDPHRNARAGDRAYNRTCSGCHAPAGSKGVACSRAPAGDCVACHMPAVERGSFQLTDHWIRAAGSGGPPPRRRAFLKIIAVESREEAQHIADGLRSDSSFFDLARRHSVDPSAGSGGFLGSTDLASLRPELADAARKLPAGGISPILESGGRFVILARPPRDFRWRAAALVGEASALKAKEQPAEAVAKLDEALRLNPHSARALVLLGAAVGETSDRARAVAVLEHAAALFPRDPAAHYNLGIAYRAAGRTDQEVASYRRAIEIEPDLTAAYLNLGAALLTAGRTADAAVEFERGLSIDPLSADLYYNLGVARDAEGRKADAERAFSLAHKIDPRLFRVKQ